MERYYELWCLRSRNRLFHSYDDGMTKPEVMALLSEIRHSDPDFPREYAFGWEEFSEDGLATCGRLDPVAFLDGREVEI